ncbi:MAG: metallophosphoesterase [Rhodoferax sp.]|nr:metallophosphoesterase [Rhodoferax sp.]
MPIDVASTFGDATLVSSVWKWLAQEGRWAFYTPAMSTQELSSHVSAKGYAPLTSIGGGEGFWLNARIAFSATQPAGVRVGAAQISDHLLPGWNLVAIGELLAPAEFNLALGPQGAAQTSSNFTSLWAWDAARSAWYFYAPSLATEAGGQALSDYVRSRNYLDFRAENVTLGPPRGFWLSLPANWRPPAPAPHAVIGSCPAGATRQAISFVHVADLHANFDPLQDKYARIRAYYQQVLAENPNTVFTNAGDDHEKGSLAEALSFGRATLEATQAMKFDVRTLGNHDFAWGESHLLDFANDPFSLVLLSGTRYTGSDPRGFGASEYGVKQVGCLKVGFFGMVSSPWNELDQTYTGNYLPNFTTDFDDVRVASNILAQHRNEVDLMVMLSHLGVVVDIPVAQAVTGIDLVLGGHSHAGASVQTVNKTLVVQPDFFGDGVTRIDIDVDLATKTIVGTRRTEVPVRTLTARDAATTSFMQGLVAKYAPQANTPVARLEKGRQGAEIAAIAARAGVAALQADGALLNPAMVNPYRNAWPIGELTPQDFYTTYLVERQKSDTPGATSLYVVEVSGAQWARMRAAQPDWVYLGPESPQLATTYKVLLHKGSALNPALFFPSDSVLGGVRFGMETWEALDGYARARTAAGLYLDSDNLVAVATQLARWTFADAADPLRADTGTLTLGYRDTAATGWGPKETVFADTDALGLPALAGSVKRVMAIPTTAPAEGYRVTRPAGGNGAFAAAGLLANYTLVMDVLWPVASDAKWRSLLQTSADNADDGDWFVNADPAGGTGIGQYFGSIPANQWVRLGLVATTAASGGALRFYINGELAGVKDDAGQRWALGNSFLLFADNSWETQPAFVAGLLFADQALGAVQMRALGGPSGRFELP